MRLHLPTTKFGGMWKIPSVFNEFIGVSSKLDALALFFARLLSGSQDGTLYLVGDGSVKPKRGIQNPLAQSQRLSLA